VKQCGFETCNSYDYGYRLHKNRTQAGPSDPDDKFIGHISTVQKMHLHQARTGVLNRVFGKLCPVLSFSVKKLKLGDDGEVKK
jgi:hypothetical protein